MSGIFDLAKLKSLAERIHPAAIIVVDTNIVAKNPDFCQWKNNVVEPIYALSDRVLIELEQIQKREQNPDSPFRQAMKSFAGLTELGDMTAGVRLAGSGWFITIPSPSDDTVKMALARMETAVKAFGHNDIQFLLLTEECDQLLEVCPGVFCTNEYNLHNFVASQGVPSIHFTHFPMNGIEKLVTRKRLKPVDWDRVLADVESEAEAKTFDVELTLTSKKLVRNWSTDYRGWSGVELSHVTLDVILAEGHGAVHTKPGTQIPFFWRLPFQPDTSEALSRDDLRGEPCLLHSSIVDSENFPINLFLMRETDLDFLGRDDEVSDDLRRGLVVALGNCATPDSSYYFGMPTLQGPLRMAEDLPVPRLNLNPLIRRIMGVEQTAEEAADEVAKSAQERQKYRPVNNYGDFRENFKVWVSDRTPEQIASFLDAVTSCWNIGHTIRTRVFPLTEDEFLTS